MRRETLATRLINEVVLYGGLPLRRCDVLRLATEDLGEHASGRFGADYFAFAPDAVDMEPMTIEEFRRVTEGATR